MTTFLRWLDANDGIVIVLLALAVVVVWSARILGANP